MSKGKDFSLEILSYIKNSPTPYHAVAVVKEELAKHQFKELKESENWGKLSPGKYFVTKEDSSLIAFVIPKDGIEGGLKLLGAHTDSPCLRIRPVSDKSVAGYFQQGVEVYGGITLSSWFDRELGLAGKVFYQKNDGEMESVLIDFEKAVAVVPNLAIHLNRNINENHTINKQTHMPPVLATSKRMNEGEKTLNGELLKLLKEKYGKKEVKKILSHDLRFYDYQAPAIAGLYDEFIMSSRLDNLLSSFVGLKALIDSGDSSPMVLALYDHEEVGSGSTAGASGPFLKSTITRICGGMSEAYRILSKSFLVSADNAHGVHPNYKEMHDDNHLPLINEGPVIKVNANQRYATTFETDGRFRHLCEKAEVPYQVITMRNDKPCGSTIGPLTAQELGVPTVDVGVPQFAMHSIREMAGTDDAFYLYKALCTLFQNR